ncbi:MAG: GAF domain-containing protein [Chloroflexi bacterium]|nr:GAF domain-containing protein [Chloroflexota bacterium]
MKILYVEDELAHVELAQRTLEDNLKEPFVLLHCVSYREALDILDKEPDIDVVLSDLRLPDGSGLDLLGKIQERQAAPAVVLVTGQGDEQVAVAALKAGAADYLVKQSDYLHRLPVAITNAVAQNNLAHEQAAKREAEFRYRSLVEQTPAVVFLDSVDENETTIYISPRIEELIGYTPQEWIADPLMWENHLHPDDKERICKADRDTHQTGERFAQEYRMIRKDGRVIWIKEDTNLIRDKNGTPLYWQGIMFDITKDKENEAAIRESEERFRRVFHASPIATCVVTLAEGRFVDANLAFVNLTGMPLEQLIGRTSVEIGFWEQPQEREDFIRMLKEQGSLKGIERRFKNVPNGPRDTLAYYELVELGRTACVLAMFYDITEQKTAQQTIRTERDFALQILNNMGQGLTVANKDGSFEYVNPAFAQMIGYSAEEIIGRSPKDFTAPEQQSVLMDERKKRQSGITSTYESLLIHKDGHEVPVTITAVPRWQNGRILGTIAVITDLTAQKQTEKALARQIRELTVLHAVSVAGTEGNSEDEIIEKVVQILAQIYEVCGVLLLNKEGNLLLPHPSYVGANVELWQDGMTIDRGVTGKSVTLGIPIRLGDVKQEPAFIEITEGIRSELCVPIRVNKKIIGILNVESRKPDAFDEEDEQFLETIAGTLSTALEKVRLYETERIRRQEADSLREATASLSAHIEIQPLLEQILASIRTIIPFDSASIFFATENGEMEIVAAAGFAPELEIIGRRVPHTAKWRELIETRRALIMSDAQTDPRFEKWEGSENIRGWMGVPMISRDKVVGFINLDSHRVNTFTERDATLAQTFANSAAVAIQNAKSFAAQREQIERESAILDLMRSASSSLNLNEVLDTILTKLIKLLGADAGSIQLLEDDRLRIAAAAGFDPKLFAPNGYVQIKDFPLNQDVIANQRAILIEDTDHHPEFKLIAGLKRTRSFLAVPLISKGKSIGLITLDNWNPSYFKERDRETGISIANHVSIAIENASLYQEALMASERRAVLHRISQDIVRFTQDLEQVYASIHGATEKLMPCDVFRIALLGRDQREIISVYTMEAGTRYNLEKRPAEHGLTGEVISTGKSIILETLADTDSYPHFGTERHVQSALAVPMRIGDRIIGMISAQSYQPQSYGSEEQAILEMLATHAATAIENARLFQEENRRTQIIETLVDIANEIATTQDIIPVLDKVTQRAMDLLDANHVAIYLLHDDNNTLKVISAQGIHKQEFLSHTLKLGEGITGNVVANGRSEIIEQVASDRRKVHLAGTPLEDAEHETMMSAPLILRGRCIGAVNAWRLRSHGVFSQVELSFLTSIANQVSVAIESSNLFKETVRRAQESAAIAEVGRDISSTLQLDVVLNRIAEYAMELLNSESSAVYLLDSTGTTLHAIAAQGLEAAEIMNDPLEMGAGILGNIALNKAGEIVNDTSTDPRAIIIKGTEETPHEHLMGVPVLEKDQLTGLVVVWRKGRYNEYKPSELDFLSSLAQQAAAAIKNARLYDEAQRRLKEVETINRLSSSMRETQSQTEMCNLLLDEALAILNAANGSVWIHDPSVNMIVQRAARGIATRVSSKQLRFGEGIVGHVFATGKYYISPDMKNDPLLAQANRESIMEGFAGVGIPIYSTDGILGVLMVQLESSRRAEDHINLLGTLAGIAGNAIHRADLFEQSQEQIRKLTTLRDIDSAIASSTDLRVTLNILMDHTLRHLKINAVDILLYHPELQNITYLCSAGFRSASPTRPLMRLGEGLAGKVILKGDIEHIPNLQASSEARLDPLLMREGFVSYIGVPLIIKGQIKGLFELYHRSPFTPNDEWMQFMQTLAGQAAIAIENSQLFENLQRSNQEIRQAYDTTLEGWARALELRDRETEGHTRRVTQKTMDLARYMNISEDEMVNIYRGVLLHDIGKMGVPDQILRKTGPLTDPEWTEMRMHPQYAFDLLSPIPYLRPALDIPYCHHEHWDGSGYPRGLKGEQIPLAARIFSIVDIWDALLSDRPYRKAWSEERVLAYLREISGTILDPAVVEAFLKMLAEEKNKTE